MKYFKLYIGLLSLFIIIMSGYNTYMNTTVVEHFNVNKKCIILLGDSILKNNSYVSKDESSVEELLSERTDKKTYCYAQDNATIQNIYSQLNKIPLELNTKDTIIYLSVGGNNIINTYVMTGIDVKDDTVLSDIFSEYVKLVKTIQKRMNVCDLAFIDIYYPTDNFYRTYYPVIDNWNNKLYDYANNPKNNIVGVLKVSTVLTQTKDFTFSIEPSGLGGEKIVNTILSK